MYKCKQKMRILLILWSNVTTKILTIVFSSLSTFNFQLIYFILQLILFRLVNILTFQYFGWYFDTMILDNDLGGAERESQLLRRAGTPAEKESSPLISPSPSPYPHPTTPISLTLFYFLFFFSPFFLLSYLFYSPFITTSLISSSPLSSPLFISFLFFLSLER